MSIPERLKASFSVLKLRLGFLSESLAPFLRSLRLLSVGTSAVLPSYMASVTFTCAGHAASQRAQRVQL